ncbi:NlpC/P60 family protein [Tumebacillus permanentifrigoris]|uniref:Peptidoglycan endopeptidase LytE n=1 Tax=Tumebacillus permanentifrigoris TaxID=378543 RepID=A0A316D9Y9_9BACL|nr:NlpC/P60 family protein [Tumebacillus permanentifrigoris]PWK12751.1 peptidoglycan endopeptidase LytE [Tumebacillus permanentifrigoris]
MNNRKNKRMALALVALFALMPLPTAVNALTTDAQSASTVQPAVPSLSYSSVARAGVLINGTAKAAINPILISGVYYVPFKDIAHVLDYDSISYNTGTKTYSATDGSVTVRVTIGGTQARKGDETLIIPAPKFINGTTYLSLDAVSAVFNTFTYFNPPDGSIRVQMPAMTYKVQAGDSLFTIAQAHHTTATAVRSSNGLKSDLLMPGQVLRLPAEDQKREMESTPQGTAPTQAPEGTTPEAATPTATLSPSAAAKAQAIITLGKKYMGVPYKFGAKTTDAPRLMDCSSFMQYIFKSQGIALPRDSRQQGAIGTKVLKSQLQPGDLIFFKYPERYSDGRIGHVGVYIGNGQMLHTIPRTGVTITKFTTSSYWTKNFLYGKRVIK